MSVKDSIKNCLRNLIPLRLRRMRIKYYEQHIPSKRIRKRWIMFNVKRRNHANILFIASSLPMWRYDGICRKLLTDSRFSVIAAICPFSTFEEKEGRREIKNLEKAFTQRHIPYRTIETQDDFISLKKLFKPDLIFYPQPYDNTFSRAIEWRSNINYLLGYVPYCLGMSSPTWGYNLPFHNTIWRQYLPSELHLREAAAHSSNHAANAIVAGEPRYDDLTTGPENDPWKRVAGTTRPKRLIWAPHFQLVQNNIFNRPDFLWTAGIMLEIAKTRQKDLQIAFKPHPRLKTSLYNHPEWGKEKTDAYYAQWASMPNTQLEEGEYTDLFKTSDAMIHNCGSFSGEYLYLRKPVAYISLDIESIKAPLHDFGLNCINSHYIVSSPEEIIDFVDNVVIGGKDTMQEQRDHIFKTQMQPPESGSVADNIYNDLIKSFHLS